VQKETDIRIPPTGMDFSNKIRNIHNDRGIFSYVTSGCNSVFTIPFTDSWNWKGFSFQPVREMKSSNKIESFPVRCTVG